MKKWLVTIVATLVLFLPSGELYAGGNAGTYNSNMYGAKTGLQRAGQVDEDAEVRLEEQQDGTLRAASINDAAGMPYSFDWRLLSALTLAGLAGALYFRRKRS
ncbi:hypothetical protein [Paenibacillus montanisoli]|uniref:Uncharacterized protein n=1 Tax=Paenibacillus montanisoli TaxID=2081970 RepID=A0A328U8D7_9BACL|nr:hypothetical protein [Paenibacillus montanisoli]RAP76336.1 hypothetical protein DL346_13140 [Paenibacillus montanisoli]